jgi:hypothetical protein
MSRAEVALITEIGYNETNPISHIADGAFF